MTEFNTVPAHTVEVPKTFTITLTDAEATELMGDLATLRFKYGFSSDVTRDIHAYLAGRNN